MLVPQSMTTGWRVWSEVEPGPYGQITVGSTVVLAEREEGTVRLEELGGLLIVVEELDLQGHGIGFDVDESARGAMLREAVGRAVQVDQERGGLRYSSPSCASVRP